MATQHTQGEWNYEAVHNNNFSKILHYEIRVGQNTIASIQHHNRIETEANAKLIASAPELLKALIEAKDVLLLDYDASNSVLDPLYRAIKKATE